MYKLFVNDLMLLITSKEEFSTIEKKFPTYKTYSSSEIEDIADFVLNITTDSIIYSENIFFNLDKIKSFFETRIAAGGIVMNESEEFLVIKRKGKLDFPKGHLEKKETLEECAKREVEEETGIGKLHIQKKIEISHHFYIENKKKILKETHWYLMQTKDNTLPRPQIEEGIEEIYWLTKSQIKENSKLFWKSLDNILENI